MSTTVLTPDKAAKIDKAELADAEAIIESIGQGYESLRNACNQILVARDVAAQRGERLEVATIYKWIELALTEAEVVQAVDLPSDREATPAAYCSVCNRFLDHDEEASGRCMTCDKVC